MTVVSLSLETELLRRFDSVCKQEGYQNRSEGMRSAMRDFINHYEININLETEMVETIVVFSYHDSNYIRRNLEKIDQKFDKSIKEKLHKHIFEDLCFDTITLNGERKKLRNIISSLRSIKGLESFHTIIIPMEHQHLDAGSDED